MKKLIYKLGFSPFWELVLIAIITVPAFFRLLNNGYFYMHDDQQVARLYLLDQGIRQGSLFPRWVDTMGFGYGYPLFNFYPPLIYYIGFIFHLIGFSYINSIKLVFISGFLLAAFGAYLFGKKIGTRLTGLITSVLYSYFFYHAVTGYVRGALAEFFSMAILPFLFLALSALEKKTDLKNILFLSGVTAVLILTHPLIALPAMIFIGSWGIFSFFRVKNRLRYVTAYFSGLILGAMLSAFFAIPSLLEKKFTLVDKILTTELANYKIHFICPAQFWYSPWGYGGSIAGCQDGITFQLGKMHLLFAGLAIFGFLILVIKRRFRSKESGLFVFSLVLLLFSLFMTTDYSLFVWTLVSPLAFLQFPWRFLAFISFFISVVGGYAVYYIQRIFKSPIISVIFIVMLIFTVFKYQTYFRPNGVRKVEDSTLISFQDIAWRISNSSFEFIPSGVATKKSTVGTTVVDISQKDLPKQQFQLVKGQANIKVLGENKFNKKSFQVAAQTPTVIMVNTYLFPGWTATIDGSPLIISANNKFHLMTVTVPTGDHTINFRFQNTFVRTIANYISILGLVVFAVLSFMEFKKKKS